MNPWMILLIIVIALWLVSLIRAGANVRYDSDGLKVKLVIGPVSFTIFPLKKKKPKKKKPEPEKKAAPESEAQKKGGNLELAKRFIPLAAEAAGRFKKKIRIDELEMQLAWGAEDPADAALGYGYANAALGMLWPIVEHNFNVRHKRLGTAVDFNAEKPVLFLLAQASLRIGQAVSLGAVIGFKALRLYLQYKKEQKSKGGVNHGKESSHQ